MNRYIYTNVLTNLIRGDVLTNLSGDILTWGRFDRTPEDLLYRDSTILWSFNIVSKESMGVCRLQIVYLRATISLVSC